MEAVQPQSQLEGPALRPEAEISCLEGRGSQQCHSGKGLSSSTVPWGSYGRNWLGGGSGWWELLQGGFLE